jgi:hypothetical protein
MVAPLSATPPSYEVRFMSLIQRGRGVAFPCDVLGHVDMDALSERARINYLFARAMVGRENAAACVCRPEMASG